MKLAVVEVQFWTILPSHMDSLPTVVFALV